MKQNAFFLTFFILNLAIGTVCANQADESRTSTKNETTTDSTSVHASGYREVYDLQPFRHVAKIPADSDKSTIRFEGAKVVQIPTKITHTMDPESCRELAFRDPGGSMYCPYTQMGSLTAAYQVTYSYIGPPLASDDFAGRNFKFDVYFRVDELPAAVKDAVNRRIKNRSELAEYFTFYALREPVQQVVIDEAQSQLCDGNYVDGTWTHSDGNCKDEILTKAVARPGDYLTVRVEPVLALAGESRKASSGAK